MGRKVLPDQKVEKEPEMQCKICFEWVNVKDYPRMPGGILWHVMNEHRADFLMEMFLSLDTFQQSEMFYKFFQEEKEIMR